MDKRYQVFVSSTYKDLIEERLEVMRALLELNAIPSGMEYFPAANEDQWTFIKNLIDTCDYYVLIVGGCYGSEDAGGKSYTQKEYEYAVSKGIPTIGFIYHDMEDLPKEKKEKSNTRIQKLNEFVALVRTKLCKDWHNKDELGAVVSRSLTQLIKNEPRLGWVRADKVGTEEILEEINQLRKDNDVLKAQISKLQAERKINTEIKDIAFDDEYLFHGTWQQHYDSTTCSWKTKMSWRRLFVLVSPYLIEWYSDLAAKNSLNAILFKEFKNERVYNHLLDDGIFQTIKVQFLALGLIQVQSLNLKGGGAGLFWGLTPKGTGIMLKERSVKGGVNL